MTIDEIIASIDKLNGLEYIWTEEDKSTNESAIYFYIDIEDFFNTKKNDSEEKIDSFENTFLEGVDLDFHELKNMSPKLYPSQKIKLTINNDKLNIENLESLSSYEKQEIFITTKIYLKKLFISFGYCFE